MKGFKEFLLRGNVIDLAVGVVIGAAFNSVVASLVADLINPLLGVVVKSPDLSGFTLSLNGSTFGVGKFINAIIGFVLVALAIYLFVIIPANRLRNRFGKNQDSTEKNCSECLSKIPVQAKRCAFCAVPQGESRA